MQARRIDKHNLTARIRDDSLDAVARRLRLRCDYGDLLTYETIEQRGLSRVRPPHNGDESRAKSRFPLLSVFLYGGHVRHEYSRCRMKLAR